MVPPNNLILLACQVMNAVTSSLKSMTEQLLCSHIESSWQKLQQENKQNTLDHGRLKMFVVVIVLIVLFHLFSVLL